MTFPLTDEPTLELLYPEGQNFLQYLFHHPNHPENERLDDHDHGHDIFFIFILCLKIKTQCVSSKKCATCKQAKHFFALTLNEKLRMEF